MVLPDVNLLLYAHNLADPRHQAACRWWDSLLAGTDGVALPWVVILGFVRLSTHQRVFTSPFTPEEATERVAEWLTLPHVTLIAPALSHFERWAALLRGVGTAGNLTTDAHLAALAIERGLVLHTTDADFARFPGLKWVNPASEKLKLRKAETLLQRIARRANGQARKLGNAAKLKAGDPQIHADLHRFRGAVGGVWEFLATRYLKIGNADN